MKHTFIVYVACVYTCGYYTAIICIVVQCVMFGPSQQQLAGITLALTSPFPSVLTLQCSQRAISHLLPLPIHAKVSCSVALLLTNTSKGGHFTLPTGAQQPPSRCILERADIPLQCFLLNSTCAGKGWSAWQKD